MTSAIEATAQLAADNAGGTILSVDALRAIAGTLSAASSSPNGVLYSGPINDTLQAYGMGDTRHYAKGAVPE
jgi:hypothetical protein